MAFPTTLNPTTPLGTDSLGAGDDQIRALKQFLADVFGFAVDPTQITAAPFSITAAGIITVLQALNLPIPVNPSDAARKSDVDLKLNKAGDTMTGTLGIMTGVRCGFRLTGTEAGGRDWIIQEFQGNIDFYRNNVGYPAEAFELIYRLPIIGTPTNNIDLTPKAYVDTRDNAVISAYQGADSAVISALTVGTTGNAPAAIIPLRTATGSTSVAALNDLDISLNDFSFYPSIAISFGGGGVISHTFGPSKDFPDDTSVNGKFRLINNGVAGDGTVVRWRYVTASDDPTIWIVYDAGGVIIGSWVSDDPAQSPAISTAGSTSAMFKSADLSNLTISEASLTQADEKIAQENWNPANRLYRGLQFEANDSAPAPWIVANCKVVGDELLMK